MAEIAKTEYLQLNQWQPEDPVLRTDFNADNQKLDAALAAVPLVKLKEVVTQQDAQQVDVDVSDIDFDAYDELIVYAEFENATASGSPSPYCYLQVNGVADASEERYGYNNSGREKGNSLDDIGMPAGKKRFLWNSRGCAAGRTYISGKCNI